MFWLKIAQIIIAVIMIVSILLQNKGASLSGVFGGANNVYMTKRGLDKVLFFISIASAALFLIAAVIGFVL